MKATAESYRLRTSEPASSRRTSTAYSTRCSRPNPTAWGWTFRSAAQSSSATGTDCGLLLTRRGAPYSASPCTSTARRSHVLDPLKLKTATPSEAGAVGDEQHFVLSGASPTPAQKRL